MAGVADYLECAKKVHSRVRYAYPLAMGLPTIIGCTTADTLTVHSISDAPVLNYALRPDKSYASFKWITVTMLSGAALFEWPQPVGDGKIFFLGYSRTNDQSVKNFRTRYIKRCARWRVALAADVSYEAAKRTLQHGDTPLGTSAILGIQLVTALLQTSDVKSAKEIVASLALSPAQATRVIADLLPHHPLLPALQSAPSSRVLQSALAYSSLLH